MLRQTRYAQSFRYRGTVRCRVYCPQRGLLIMEIIRALSILLHTTQTSPTCYFKPRNPYIPVNQHSLFIPSRISQTNLKYLQHFLNFPSCQPIDADHISFDLRGIKIGSITTFGIKSLHNSFSTVNIVVCSLHA